MSCLQSMWQFKAFYDHSTNNHIQLKFQVRTRCIKLRRYRFSSINCCSYGMEKSRSNEPGFPLFTTLQRIVWTHCIHSTVPPISKIFVKKYFLLPFDAKTQHIHEKSTKEIEMVQGFLLRLLHPFLTIPVGN